MDARERELSDAVEEAYRGAVLVEYPNAHKTAAGIHDCDITKLKEGETCAFLGTDWKRAAEAAAPPVAPLKHYHERPISSTYDAAIEQIEKAKQPGVAAVIVEAGTEISELKTQLSAARAELKLHAEDAEGAAKVGRVHICNSNCTHEAAVPESQDGLPPLDVQNDDVFASLELMRSVPLDEEFAKVRTRLQIQIQRTLCRERQLSAAHAELRDLKLAASLACELHGCASAGCTMAQYHEDVQKLFADLAVKDAQIANLTKEA